MQLWFVSLLIYMKHKWLPGRKPNLFYCVCGEIGFGLRRPAVRRVVGVGNDSNLDMKLMYHYDLSFVSVNTTISLVHGISQTSVFVHRTLNKLSGLKTLSFQNLMSDIPTDKRPLTTSSPRCSFKLTRR